MFPGKKQSRRAKKKKERKKEVERGWKEKKKERKKREESNISFASTTIPPEAVLLWRGSERVRVLVGHVESDYLTRALAHVWLVKELLPIPPTFGLPLPLFRGSSSRLCLVLSDIDHSNSLRSTLYRATSLVSRSTFSPSFSSPSSISPILDRCSLAINAGPSSPLKCRFPLCYSSPKFNLTPTLSRGLICPSLVVKTQAQTCRIYSEGYADSYTERILYGGRRWSEVSFRKIMGIWTIFRVDLGVG